MIAESRGGSVDRIVLAYALMDRLPPTACDDPDVAGIMDPLEGWYFAYDQLSEAVGALLTSERYALLAMHQAGLEPGFNRDELPHDRSLEEQRLRLVGRALFDFGLLDR